ncbi:MAG TPA: NAD-dependent epimerase/dehydratase family protein [Rhizomicrobium sp.]|nr:NAD-dependent epimerase/dehydratase family protein [Rhizomicrobium sp.]
MKIFVTGASGFVGNAFVRECAKRHQITAMSRSPASDEKIKMAGATPVRCSLDDVTAEHMRGADAVMHCAAHVEEWGKWSDFWRFNVDGTKRMLAEAKKAGVKRFVHIGTEAALFYGQNMRNVDETYPLAFKSPFPYSRTKAFAEKAVREANDPAHAFETIVVRPRFVWGPGDETLLPVLRRMAGEGQFAWIGGGHNKTSTTYIGNLVYAMELALTKGKSGEAYFVLDGPPVEFRDMVTRMTRAAGFSLPDKELPGWLVRAAAFASEKAWRILPLPGRPPVTRFAANIMCRDCILVDAKARAEMGYSPPFTVDAGLKALAEGGV